MKSFFKACLSGSIKQSKQNKMELSINKNKANVVQVHLP